MNPPSFLFQPKLDLGGSLSLDRYLTIGFLALLLTLSVGVHQLLMGSLPPTPVAVAGTTVTEAARGAAGPGSTHVAATPVVQKREVRAEMAVSAGRGHDRLPDGGIYANSRGTWLTDAPDGKPELLDRGAVPRQSVLLPILMYHHVRPIDFKTSNRFVSELTLPPAEFQQQLEYLKGRGIATVSMEDLWLYLQGREDPPPLAVILTFDDGYADNYQYALPLLRRYGATATFFIITGLIGKDDYMAWGNLRELVAAGMEIGGHTVAHVDLTVTPPILRDRELSQSKRTLEDKLGVSVRALSYPGGAFNADVEAAARKAGYVIAVTTRPGAVDDRAKIMELPRVRISGTDTLPAFRWKIEQFFPAKGPGAR